MPLYKPFSTACRPSEFHRRCDPREVTLIYATSRLLPAIQDGGHSFSSRSLPAHLATLVRGLSNLSVQPRLEARKEIGGGQAVGGTVGNVARQPEGCEHRGGRGAARAVPKYRARPGAARGARRGGGTAASLQPSYRAREELCGEGRSIGAINNGGGGREIDMHFRLAPGTCRQT